jgi:hypothetical protein
VPFELTVTPSSPEIVTSPDPSLTISTLYPLSIASKEFSGIVIIVSDVLSTVITLPASDAVIV